MKFILSIAIAVFVAANVNAAKLNPPLYSADTTAQDANQAVKGDIYHQRTDMNNEIAIRRD